jgi:hypothetical protein
MISSMLVPSSAITLSVVSISCVTRPPKLPHLLALPTVSVSSTTMLRTVVARHKTKYINIQKTLSATSIFYKKHILQQVLSTKIVSQQSSRVILKIIKVKE